MPPSGAKRLVQAEVAHHRRDQRLLLEPSRLQEIYGSDGQNFVAVHELPFFVAQQNPIGIAVMGDANLRAAFFDDSLNFSRESAAAFRVDVCAVRLVVNDRYIGAQLAQNARR